MSIDPATLAALLQAAQQGQNQQQSQNSQNAQTALAGLSTVANIWSGYQADKSNDKALKMEQERQAYERKKAEEETARRTRRDLKGETASDAANSMGYLDWLNKRFTPGVQ
jgi:hypothetical protein